MKKTLICLAIAATALTGCGIPYSDGARVGTIQKVSRKGIFWKTYEGELVMDGVRRTGQNGAMTNIWKFSAKDAAVVQAATAAAEKSLHVKLTYDQFLFDPVWSSGTGYIVTKVEVIQ